VNRIVILGAGCGGLNVARALRFVTAEVTLVDRQDSYLFSWRLYSAAVGTGEPRRLRIRTQALLHGQRNAKVIQGEGVYLDAGKRRLMLTDRSLPYDVLVVATGSRPRYERDQWQLIAPSLKSPEDAGRIREKLRDRNTTIVVAGGGVTGVELAAAVARDDRARRVVLVESGPRVLSGFSEPLADDAVRQLLRLGVEIRCGLHVIGMDAESIRVSGAQGRERILSRAILWTGGVEASGFGATIQRETGVALDETGRVCVNPDLTIAGYPEIFVIGDLARVLHDGQPLGGLATVASQQGRYVASAIRERMAGYAARPFEYVDQGRFAILGRGGVGLLGDTQLRGAPAWLASKLAQQWSAPGDLLPRFRSYSATAGSRT
jgi:NADH dehydrogenase